MGLAKEITYKERRDEDNKREQIVHEFLINKIFGKFPDYQYFQDKKTQVNGCDCMFTGKNGFKYIADEKAVTGDKYIHGDKLKTFCLELSMRHFSKMNVEWIRYDGWLMHDDFATNSYILTWIDLIGKNGFVNTDSILEAEVCVVRKDMIFEMLDNIGWNKNRLSKQIAEMSKNVDAYLGTNTIDGLRFSIPPWLKNKECPINIILNRDTYRNICDFNMVFHQ